MQSPTFLRSPPQIEKNSGRSMTQTRPMIRGRDPVVRLISQTLATRFLSSQSNSSVALPNSLSPTSSSTTTVALSLLHLRHPSCRTVASSSHPEPLFKLFLLPRCSLSRRVRAKRCSWIPGAEEFLSVCSDMRRSFFLSFHTEREATPSGRPTVLALEPPHPPFLVHKGKK